MKKGLKQNCPKGVYKEKLKKFTLKISLSEKELEETFKQTIQKLSKRCARCGSLASIHGGKEYMMRCNWRPCRKIFSLLEGTPFHATKVSIINVLKIIRMWCTKVKLTAISELLGISKQSVGKIINKMAKRVVPNYQAAMEKIGGPGVIVEIHYRTKVLGQRKWQKIAGFDTFRWTN
jgi:transposase-like protein